MVQLYKNRWKKKVLMVQNSFNENIIIKKFNGSRFNWIKHRWKYNIKYRFNGSRFNCISKLYKNRWQYNKK